VKRTYDLAEVGDTIVVSYQLVSFPKGQRQAMWLPSRDMARFLVIRG
jgi:hypothetical protein